MAYPRVQRVRLLRPEKPIKSGGLLFGEDSGIVNWDNIAYPSFYEIWLKISRHFWTTDDISLGEDVVQWETLSPAEQNTFKRIFGRISTLDSIQGLYLYHLTQRITDSSVKHILVNIANYENIHNQSYSFELSSLVPEEENEVFERGKNDPIIQKINQPVLDAYHNFINEPTPENTIKGLAASACLEGVQFYVAFAFFYHLANNGKMLQTSTLISYIQRDELEHCHFMSQLYRAILTEHPELNNEEIVSYTYDLVTQVVELEKEWCREVLTDIEGISVEEFEEYIEYIANKRLRYLGLDDVYEDRENVMPWISTFSDESLENTKTDFFEQRNRSYAKKSNKKNKINEFLSGSPVVIKPEEDELFSKYL